MRKTGNAIILLHSVVSHTMKKKIGGTESLLVCCALFLSASGVCDAVTCDSGHLIIEASVFLFSSFFLEFVRTPLASGIVCWPPRSKRMHCANTVRSGMHSRTRCCSSNLWASCFAKPVIVACHRHFVPVSALLFVAVLYRSWQFPPQDEVRPPDTRWRGRSKTR